MADCKQQIISTIPDNTCCSHTFVNVVIFSSSQISKDFSNLIVNSSQIVLEKLTKIYIVACWARFGVREYPFTGKFIKDKHRGNMYIPLVYDYDDCNGTCDNYYLRKITDVTTGNIVLWTQNRNIAEKISAMYNQHMV